MKRMMTMTKMMAEAIMKNNTTTKKMMNKSKAVKERRTEDLNRVKMR